MFEVTVNTRRAVVGTKELITTSSAGIQVQFTFSEDWDSLSKIAIFRNGDDANLIPVAVPNSNLVTIPAQSCSEDFVDEPLFVGVYGTDGLGAVIIPTVWTSLGVLRPGAVTTDIITPPEPTPDMWAQILAIANEAAAIADECEANEELRVAAEQLRAGAETARANAEALRAAAEDARAENENQRQGAETQRQAAEDARAQAEALRIQAEELRQTNETSRVSAEIDRASAEQTRQTNEATRASNEAARVTAEQNRASAETQRASAESSRVTEETSRVSAESSRATAEQDRASAETARASAESQRVTAENNRVSAEQNRVNAEDERVQAETDRAAEFANWEGTIASKVPNTRTVNGKALSTDITLDAGDIGYDSTETYQAGSVGAELQEQNRQLSDLEDTVSTTQITNTVSGAIASFDDGADGIPIRKLVAQIEPVQDLHGYDSPWPAGGGKNKFQVTATTQTINGVTFTVNEDGTVLVNGTATDYTGFVLGNASFLTGTESETYILSGCPSGGSSSTYNVDVAGADGYDSGNGVTLRYQPTISNTATRIRVNPGTTVSNLVFKPMIRLATETDATFVPYENICPISGHTGAEIEQTGVNVWDEEFEHGNINNSTGELVPDTSLYRSKNVIPVKGDSVYYLATNSNYNAIIYWYDKEMNYLGYIDQTANSTRTAPSNAYYARLRFFSNVTNMEKGHFSINYPATATSYVPYTGNQISVNWEDEAGTVYSGYIDVVSGKLVVDRAINTIAGMNFVYQSDSNRFYTTALKDVIKIPSTAETSAICESFVVKPWDQRSSAQELSIAESGNVFLFQPIYTSVEELNSAVGNTKFCYELATPIEYTLTPHELTTLYGTNNVWIDTGAITECDYPADTKLYIDNKITTAIANALNS